jgi:hypothetical protein
MNDYRRSKSGRLLPAFLMRQPSRTELDDGQRDGVFVRDPWLGQHLRDLAGSAHLPDRLAPLLEDSDDGEFEEDFVEEQSRLGRQFLELERERDAERKRADENRALANRLSRQRDEARAALRRAKGEGPFVDDARALARRAAKGVHRRLLKS